MFVSASTPFDPLLPANGSALRAGILTSFLVLLISTLIMWIASSLQVKTRKKTREIKNIPRKKIEIGGTKIPGNRCAMTSSRQKRRADDITQRHWINKVIYVCRTIQPKPSQKSQNDQLNIPPTWRKKLSPKKKIRETDVRSPRPWWFDEKNFEKFDHRWRSFLHKARGSLKRFICDI